MTALDDHAAEVLWIGPTCSPRSQKLLGLDAARTPPDRAADCYHRGAGMTAWLVLAGCAGFATGPHVVATQPGAWHDSVLLAAPIVAWLVWARSRTSR